MRGAGAVIGLRDGLLAVLSIGFGLTIGYLDSRPAWDDTGITAALLLLTAAIAAALSRRRPWLWALLIGASVPLFEIGGPAGLASLAGLAIAAIGAFGAYLVVRASESQP